MFIFTYLVFFTIVFFLLCHLSSPSIKYKFFEGSYLSPIYPVPTKSVLNEPFLNKQKICKASHIYIFKYLSVYHILIYLNVWTPQHPLINYYQIAKALEKYIKASNKSICEYLLQNKIQGIL